MSNLRSRGFNKPRVALALAVVVANLGLCAIPSSAERLGCYTCVLKEGDQADCRLTAGRLARQGFVSVTVVLR